MWVWIFIEDESPLTRHWPQQGGFRSARLHAWLFWRKPQPCGFQCFAIHLGLGPLCLVSPPCVRKEVICYCPCLLLSPVQPFLVCWCSDQSAITHQTDVRTWTGQMVCAEDTQPAGSQLQLFTLWGWACWGPGGRGYQ